MLRDLVLQPFPAHHLPTERVEMIFHTVGLSLLLVSCSVAKAEARVVAGARHAISSTVLKEERNYRRNCAFRRPNARSGTPRMGQRAMMHSSEIGTAHAAQ